MMRRVKLLVNKVTMDILALLFVMIDARHMWDLACVNQEHCYIRWIPLAPRSDRGCSQVYNIFSPMLSFPSVDSQNVSTEVCVILVICFYFTCVPYQSSGLL